MNSLKLPPILYGTAWKEGATADLTAQAIRSGYRGIDTANQRVHYWEDSVGDALESIYKEGISREDLFLQTKYTYERGQDHRLPYDPKADFATQVGSSFDSSLEHLHTDYLDSYVLHGPMSSQAITDADWEAWSAMEGLATEGKVRLIGVSNVGLHHLTQLCEHVKIKPSVVQNRCYAVTGWDSEIRNYCKSNGIVYQGFSLLTANPQVVQSSEVGMIAERLKVTREQVILRFAMHIGILPLTGTTSVDHMKDDLARNIFFLSG